MEAHTLLATVERLTGISREQITSQSRQAEVVDARHLYVKAMHDQGHYMRTIAYHSGLSIRAAQAAVSGFYQRLRQSQQLRTIYEQLTQQLRAN
jgi:hypothetical protein